MNTPREFLASTTSDDAVDHLPPAATIRDWGGVVSFTPKLYFRPHSMEELKGFITAIAHGLFAPEHIRILGSLHSCSQIFASDTVIDVSEMPRTIEFSPDNSTVIASANWTLHDFLLELSARGKSITATGGTDAQTLAGLISTNTAPATSQTTVYELVDWIEYLAIDNGSLVERRVHAGDPEFAAVVCSLGAIGVLTRVQFRLVDELYFSTIQKIVPLDEVLKDLAATSKQYDFWRIDWVPDTSQGLLWAANRIPKDQADPDGDYKPDQAENVLVFLFTMWDKISKGADGPLLGGPMKVVYKLMAAFYNLDETKATGPLRTMLPVDRRAPLHVAMAEWGFNPADMDRLITLCRDYYQQNGWPNMPIEIELTKTDNYAMSAWNWDGLDYIVKINFMYLTDVCNTPEAKAQIYTHLQGLWNLFTQSGIKFKAHWGKINFMDYDFVRQHFHLDRFEGFIHPLFVNDYLRQRILPSA